MRRFEVSEIMGRLLGTYVERSKNEKQGAHKLQHLYQPKAISNHVTADESSNNGVFLNGLNSSFSASKVPSLQESINKLKVQLTQIRSSSKPGSREASLPITSPLLKLCLLEDPKDTGEVNEDLMVRIFKEALPSMLEAELHQVLCLGRVGPVKERRVDYMKMLENVERLVHCAPVG